MEDVKGKEHEEWQETYVITPMWTPCLAPVAIEAVSKCIIVMFIVSFSLLWLVKLIWYCMIELVVRGTDILPSGSQRFVSSLHNSARRTSGIPYIVDRIVYVLTDKVVCGSPHRLILTINQRLYMWQSTVSQVVMRGAYLPRRRNNFSLPDISLLVPWTN
jgi:hypothetical protein